MPRALGRLLTAMVTPFDGRGDVDLDQAARLARALVAAGCDGVVVNGTTGESPTLTDTERWQLFDRVRATLPDSTVMMGTGTYDTAHSVALTREAGARGADAALVVAPYYNRPPQDGLIAHFHAIAEVGVPVVLYNIPARCGVNLSVATSLRLARHPHIVGTKEAAGDVDQVARICAAAPEGFLVWSGDDGLTLPFMSVGAHGVISVAAHVAAAALRRMVDAAASGDLTTATALHSRLLPLYGGLFAVTNPIGVKGALQHIGVDCGSLRLPLLPLDDEHRSRLGTLLDSLPELVGLPVDAAAVSSLVE
jgi:4-hydroxy-tetrahydrodipicolinate synthase